MVRDALCRQLVHIDLATIGFFPRLLEGEAEIGLISCFPELPGLLKERFGIGHVEFHKLPGEQHFKDMIGAEATAGRHFPDVYEGVMARLSRPHEGRIVLVAGGILGKFYARTVRQWGGIAIDVGSLADAWVAKPTRPGYETLGALSLASAGS